MREKITKRAVDAAKPSRRDLLIWDTELRGFGLKVTPGGSKIYVLQYRMGGPARRYTIGLHGSPWTPETARLEAMRARGEVAARRDPGNAKATKLSVRGLCELYLAEGVATKKPSTLATDRGRVARHILPLLGRKQVCDVARADVERFLRDIAAGKTKADIKTGKHGRAIVKGGKGTATRTLGLLGGIFSFAVDRGLRSDNPVQGVKRYRDQKGERYLSAGELARLGKSLRGGGENPIAVAGIQLLILTGARKSEIQTVKWEHVDFERSCLRLPDSKTGAKTIPLGAAALALLHKLPRFEGNPYVLPGQKKEGYYVGLPKAWLRVRKVARLDSVRLHDLRHSFASVAASAGDSLLLIGAILGHKDSKTTQRYAHLSNDPIKAAADRTSGSIAAAMAGGLGEVIKLPQKTA